MIAEEQTISVDKQAMNSKIWTWLGTGITLILAGFGIWYLTRRVDLLTVAAALSEAKLAYIALSLAFVLLILVLKSWRWELLLRSSRRDISIGPLFWATMLGHYVNLIVPFFRLGDVARIYALHRQTGTSNMRALGTLVVEKALDMIMLILTMVLLLPIIALPDFMGEPGIALGSITLLIVVALYMLAFQTSFVLRVVTNVSSWLPRPISNRIVGIVGSGLDGLSGLKDKRISLSLVVISGVLAFLSILPPYFLLLALDIPLGLAEATLINIVVTIALTPPSTPAKIGVFDGTVAFMLLRFGISNEALIASYTIIYHLVAVLPLILLGSAAASRTNWRWHQGARYDN